MRNSECGIKGRAAPNNTFRHPEVLEGSHPHFLLLRLRGFFDSASLAQNDGTIISIVIPRKSHIGVPRKIANFVGVVAYRATLGFPAKSNRFCGGWRRGISTLQEATPPVHRFCRAKHRLPQGNIIASEARNGVFCAKKGRISASFFLIG